MTVCLIDAWRAGDPALANSHWVAERTAAVLHGRGVEHHMLDGDRLDAAAVGAVLSQAFEGYVYFGHGREHLLYRDKDPSGAPIPLVGTGQLGRIEARWFHAFACLSGHTLCQDAAREGAAVYVGYRVPVIVEWEISRLPGELCGLLQELVTVATMELVEGRRSRGAVRLRVRAASDRLLEWLDTNEDVCASIPWIELVGLQLLANLLHRDLEMEGSAVVP